jgi:hypothetical protein
LKKDVGFRVIISIMPAQISHIIAGEMALERAAPGLMAALGDPAHVRQAAWFRLGCQGPDIFYHNQRTKPLGLHYGALAHRRGYGRLVEACLLKILAAGDSSTYGALERPDVAWLLGFATHAALDRAMHPFIVYFSGWASPGKPETSRFRGAHPFLERLIDIHILGKYRDEEVRAFDLEKLLPLEADASADAEVSCLLRAGLVAAYPGQAGADFLLDQRIANTFADARYFLRATNPARTEDEDADGYAYLDDRIGPRTMSVVYPSSLPAGLDIANEAHRPWRHPADDGRGSMADCVELFESGVEAAAKALGTVLGVLDGKAVPAEAARVIGDDGLSINDRQGRPARPLVCDPLPLHAVMDVEFRRRIARAKAAAERHPPGDALRTTGLR